MSLPERDRRLQSLSPSANALRLDKTRMKHQTSPPKTVVNGGFADTPRHENRRKNISNGGIAKTIWHKARQQGNPKPVEAAGRHDCVTPHDSVLDTEMKSDKYIDDFSNFARS